MVVLLLPENLPLESKHGYVLNVRKFRYRALGFSKRRVVLLWRLQFKVPLALSSHGYFKTMLLTKVRIKTRLCIPCISVLVGIFVAVLLCVAISRDLR